MSNIWLHHQGDDLRQGDILDQCAIPVLSPEFSVESISDEPEELGIETRRLIVITQSCDLENGKALYVALCPVHTLEEMENVDAQFLKKNKWEEVRRGKIEGLYMLPSPQDPAVNRQSLVASDWWIAWHSFQFDCGERTGAMLKLRWEWLSPRGIDIPGEARKCGKAAFYRLSERTNERLSAIRSPSRDLIFHWPASVSCFYLHYGRLLTLAGLPSDRRSKPQRVRRSHLTYWHAGGEDATARAKHSSPDVTAKHYIDESLLPQIDPASVLPTL